MPSRDRERAVGLACAALVVAVWSSFIPISRLGLGRHLGPADLVALRFAVAGTLMLPVLVRRGLPPVSAWRLAVVAITAGLGFSTLAFTGLSLAPASHAAVLMPGTLPLWTALLARVWLGERLGALRAVGILLIAAGVAAMAADTVRGGAAGQWRGDLCFPAASLLWAVFTVATRAWKVSPIDASAVVSVGSMAVGVPAYLLLFDARLAAAPAGEVLFHALYQGVLSTVVSVLAFLRAVAALGAAPTAMLTAAVPVVATLLAVPMLGERPGWAALLGLVLVTAGMLTAVVGARAAR